MEKNWGKGILSKHKTRWGGLSDFSRFQHHGGIVSGVGGVFVSRLTLPHGLRRARGGLPRDRWLYHSSTDTVRKRVASVNAVTSNAPASPSTSCFPPTSIWMLAHQWNNSTSHRRLLKIFYLFNWQLPPNRRGVCKVLLFMHIFSSSVLYFFHAVLH